MEVGEVEVFSDGFSFINIPLPPPPPTTIMKLERVGWGGYYLVIGRKLCQCQEEMGTSPTRFLNVVKMM